MNPYLSRLKRYPSSSLPQVRSGLALAESELEVNSAAPRSLDSRLNQQG
jgi:hypothetical protein